MIPARGIRGDLPTQAGPTATTAAGPGGTVSAGPTGTVSAGPTGTVSAGTAGVVSAGTGGAGSAGTARADHRPAGAAPVCAPPAGLAAARLVSGPDDPAGPLAGAPGGEPAPAAGPPVESLDRFTSGAWPMAGRRFPTLTVATPRLHVRPVVPEDAEPVSAIFADRQTRRWLPIPREYGQIDGRAWCMEMAEERRATGTGDHYAVVRREDDRVVGCLWTKRTDWVARMTEISYAICPELRGFGVAAEAVDGLAIALVLERGFERIEMRVAPGNIASRRVAEKAGFHYEGLLRNAAHVHSGRVDLEVWSLVAADLR